MVGISRKKIMARNLPEERKVMREPLPSARRHLLLEFLFFSPKIALFLFSLLMITAEKRACRKRDQTIAFPRSSWLLTMNARGSVISLASGFSC